MRLKGLDLNLLVALDILLDELSVTRAAERMHLSQPAVSAALARLRAFFQDDLFVLHGKRLIPTSYAKKLMPEVKHILKQLDDLISLSNEFDPASSERLFRLMASDYLSTVLLTDMVSTMQSVAPNVKLDTRLPEDSVHAIFERGEIDLMLIPEEFLNENHPAELLLEEPHVVVGWEGNQLFDQGISKQDFFKAGHIAVTLGSNRDPSFTERNMTKLGFDRRIDISAPYFSAVPWMLLNTNRIAMMQERLARTYAKALPLKISPLPFDFPAMRIMAQYHSARESDLGLKWFLELLQKVAGNP